MAAWPGGNNRAVRCLVSESKRGEKSVRASVEKGECTTVAPVGESGNARANARSVASDSDALDPLAGGAEVTSAHLSNTAQKRFEWQQRRQNR